MKMPGDLVSFVCEEYHKYKDDAWFPVQDEIRTRLPTQKTEEMHTTHLQLMQLLQLAITQSLFAALIAVVLCMTVGHQGMVK